jgi:hypothetical protein
VGFESLSSVLQNNMEDMAMNITVVGRVIIFCFSTTFGKPNGENNPGNNNNNNMEVCSISPESN